MVGVAAHAVADDLGQNGRAAAARVLVFLEHQNAGAFADDEAVAVAGPRGGRRAAGSSIALRKRAHGGESADAHGRDAASVPPQIITSASPRWMMRKESPMECALVVQAVAVAELGPLAPIADGDVAGGQIDDGGRDKERRDAARPLFQQDLVLALDDLEPADPAADVDAGTLGFVFVRDLEARSPGMANSLAAMANWMKRPIFLISFFSM